MSEGVNDDEDHRNSGVCPSPEVLEGPHMSLTGK